MSLLSNARKFGRIFWLSSPERQLLKEAQNAGTFDPVYYRGAYPQVHKLFQKFPLRHYIVYGESMGLRPNPDFSPMAYLRYNPDVAETGMSPLLHFSVGGRHEERVTKELPKVEELPQKDTPKLRFEGDRCVARFAIVMHIYYPDLWPEFAETLERLDFEYDLYVTLTYRGEQTDDLAAEISAKYPDATVVSMQNRGRDILPFMNLLNAGAFDKYEAVCKIHTKKSPHREDGDVWRRHLINGILPEENLDQMLETFVADPKAGFWVADGQHFTGLEWWGSNIEMTQSLLRRLEMEIDGSHLSFPAGSIYWVKPSILRLLKALHLLEAEFDVECAQVDGTVAHSLERVMGFLALAADQDILQTTQLETRKPTARKGATPTFTSAFYLPQFHPIAENDAWWGKGFTEWRGTITAHSMFPGHTQPLLPSDLGYYDLRVTEVLGQQAELARDAGIDAFCVYHYWFDGRRVLEEPLDRLLARPDVDFPFYLCWANESWRRNWDGLSGTVLLEQTYAKGFEEQLVNDSLPYMQDARYQRPDGVRPRFVIYRPEDMPDPKGSVERMRDAWRKAGIGEVELGAVCFHISGESAVEDDVFDFWIEMPPHGMVTGEDYLFGGPQGNQLNRPVAGGFEGLVYDYNKVIKNSVSESYLENLPDNTICGVMPSWDNTARRGLSAHIAYGANPASFGHWLDEVKAYRIEGSYRGEMFINAWNEWAEKAILEPSDKYGDQYLQVLKSRIATSPEEDVQEQVA
ncbi:glycoside hydrolase family 99-like domain-containing protein [Shimia thalassica]|uniref:glycoside hydrolase family 99-like domain-containing protein n=1 Tax=Shimia thalassica TaxID=1715693 RepID=UPI0027374C29|nr:glycoside hydrolase family 99-like domain-containing protein [Shimia thalassica]MDP2580119.1 glycoside hydrolase family 99-like domain-containing protein [Shimia thalassica]